ncbi:peptide ABC transporter substrate-binding protein [Alicyclobacillus dauci]|uniref:Peptide ABC transporter substrate-binding protein n=1 Tax=Alicyclobacillus dauci TaxID=1475485 RepID=A0ABY6Z171_9BACL|nr:peptide ABC transporter substrate-binding protein [Alicyclobacillus dauci]WAH36638.1 peptide ABC transporter substrate-binding protein [Alicyclobacillus dauci]
MKRKWYGTVGAALALTLLTAGCGQSGGAATGAKTTGSNGSGSQSISMDILTEPPTLDPAKSTDTTSGWVIDQLMEGLTYLGKDNTPQPGIAKSWDISKDGTVYTFHLRDAKWTNGDPVTADDFVYAIKHALDPNTGAQFASYLYYIKGAQAYNTNKGSADAVGIKAVDAHTLQFTLEHPTPFFLSLTTFWPYFPVDQKVAKSTPNWTAEASTYVSDGPFKLSQWQHQHQLILEKNPDYWDASSIKLNKVTATIVNDSNTQYQMFKSGQLDMDTQLPLNVIPNAIKDGTAKVYPFAGTCFLELNTTKKPFDNPDIRKAFSVAIDRQSLVQNVTQGGEKPAFAMVAPGLPGANGEFRSEGGNLIQENANEAKQLLAKGLKEEGLTQLPPVTLDYNTLEANQQIAQALQQMWKQNLGVTVNLQNEEWKVYLDKLTKGNFQFGRMGWIDVYTDPTATLDYFKSDFGSNYTHWSNPKYDQLVTAAESTTDTAKRMQDMHQAEQILMNDEPAIPLYFYTHVFTFSPKLQGIVVHPNAEFPDIRFMSVQ